MNVKNIFIIPIIFLLFFYCNDYSAKDNFSGKYEYKNNNVVITLNLKQTGNSLKGDLSSTKGVSYKMDGILKNLFSAEGKCKGDKAFLFFEANLKGTQLILDLIEPGQDNKPNFNKSRRVAFIKTSNSEKQNSEIDQLFSGETKKEKTNNIKAIQPDNPVKTKNSNRSINTVNLSRDFVTDPNWGFKVFIPTGWKYKKGNNNIVFGHGSIAGAIIVFPHMSNNIGQVKNDLVKGISEQSLQLRLSGSITNITQNILAGDYTGVMNGEQVKARGFGTLSPHGGGAFIIAITTPAKYSNDLIGSARTIASGIEYKKIARSNISSHFVGKWKTYTKHSETTAVLYADGRFAMRNTSSYGGTKNAPVGGVWGTAADRDSSGKWSVRGNKSQGVLILTYNNGSSDSINYRVHSKGGTTYWSEYYFGGVLYGKQ